MIECTDSERLSVYSSEAAPLLAELIQNNDNLHHPVVTGTSAVTAAAAVSVRLNACLCVCVCVPTACVRVCLQSCPVK